MWGFEDFKNGFGGFAAVLIIGIIVYFVCKCLILIVKGIRTQAGYGEVHVQTERQKKKRIEEEEEERAWKKLEERVEGMIKARVEDEARRVIEEANSFINHLGIRIFTSLDPDEEKSEGMIRIENEELEKFRIIQNLPEGLSREEMLKKMHGLIISVDMRLFQEWYVCSSEYALVKGKLTKQEVSTDHYKGKFEQVERELGALLLSYNRIKNDNERLKAELEIAVRNR